MLEPNPGALNPLVASNHTLACLKRGGLGPLASEVWRHSSLVWALATPIKCSIYASFPVLVTGGERNEWQGTGVEFWQTTHQLSPPVPSPDCRNANQITRNLPFYCLFTFYWPFDDFWHMASGFGVGPVSEWHLPVFLLSAQSILLLMWAVKPACSLHIFLPWMDPNPSLSQDGWHG